jgi:glutamyl-tRNA synthetase
VLGLFARRASRTARAPRAQEKDEFVDNILADVAALGVAYQRVTHTSDYFPQLADLAERLLRAGHLYADDTPLEQMRAVRPPT